MEQALTFNAIPLPSIPHQNSLCIRAAEVARTLGIAMKARFPAFTAVMPTSSRRE
ncbi:hypothetical protein [uncultured Desulfovibrio sp.]|uniref:hypothetical protein n=1 Tax=uncultured Desulfovibrio sp. TaxID=167968 RepID=UPI00262F34B8|nr:hypothetical protein [uncultured Desulfovibrio sp.]